MSAIAPEFQRTVRLPSGIKKGPDLLKTNSRDIFDRIINLRFHRRHGDSFCLRSDYEPVYRAAGVSFRRCVQKPDIKVSYKQVANDVSIGVTISVTNLFIDTTQGDSPLRAEENPIESIDVQMGYIGQFPDWTDEFHRTAADVRSFFELDGSIPGLMTSPDDPHPEMPSAIRVQVLSSHTNGVPPDQVTMFNGIVGTDDVGLLWQWEEKDLAPGYGLPAGYNKSAVRNKAPSLIEDILFQWITRRFPGSDVQARIVTKRGLRTVYSVVDDAERQEEVITSQRFEVFGYSHYAAWGGRAVFNGRGAAPDVSLPKLPENAVWETVPLEQNLLSVQDALKFGVLCFVSDYLRARTLKKLYRGRMDGLSTEEQARFAGIAERPFTTSQGKLGGTLEDIQKHFPFLRWYQLPNGHFYFYHSSEDLAGLLTDSFVRYQQGEVVFLPAVYDIQLVGTRTIRAPFVSFISPMTTVAFQSRYSLGSLVSFFYHPKTGDDQYLVLLNDIEFGTTDDSNMMTMTCVDVPGSYKANVDGTTGKSSPAVLETAAVPEETVPAYTWAWKKRTAVSRLGGLLGVRPVWVFDVAGRLLYSSPKDDQHPYGTAALFPVVDLLADWNPGLFSWDKIKDAPCGAENLTELGQAYLEYGKREHPDRYPSDAQWALPHIGEGVFLQYKYPLKDEYPDDEMIPPGEPTEDVP